jgi:hypothetical protein
MTTAGRTMRRITQKRSNTNRDAQLLATTALPQTFMYQGVHSLGRSPRLSQSQIPKSPSVGFCSQQRVVDRCWGRTFICNRGSKDSSAILVSGAYGPVMLFYIVFLVHLRIRTNCEDSSGGEGGQHCRLNKYEQAALSRSRDIYRDISTCHS